MKYKNIKDSFHGHFFGITAIERIEPVYIAAIHILMVAHGNSWQTNALATIYVTRTFV